MKDHQWFILNIGLSLIAVLLFLNFIDIQLPSVGKVLYELDDEQPSCVVEWEGQATAWNDLNRCCLEAQAQLECSQEKESKNGKQWICKTGDKLQYKLNNKAYRYCQQQAFWR